MPVFVDETGGIVAGSSRTLARQMRGITDVSVMVTSGWSEAQKRAYAIAGNKLALSARWGEELLKPDLGNLSVLGFGRSLTRFCGGDGKNRLGWAVGISGSASRIVFTCWPAPIAKAAGAPAERIGW